MNSVVCPSNGTSPEHLLQSQKGAATLQGWKNIAFELDRGVRTVQRWERDLGLPVHRVGKRPRRPVFAFAEELYSWLRKTADLRSYMDSPVVNDSLQEQKNQSRTVNQPREAELVEDRVRYPQTRKTSNARTPQAIVKFVAEESSRCLAGDCEQCRCPLKVVEGRLRISGAKQDRVISIICCPICDLERFGLSGAGQCITFHRSAFRVATSAEA